jgi:diaminohydroxyphosphoribosylaminopyrimidine deaminase/5-amino-6-(5-phosphoribosylamino)uracil reductase
MNTQTETDIKYMQRCLDLARQGEGKTYPNPMVGSVIVHNGLIIGEGYHRQAGGPHAEVWAINSVANQDLLKESTLYVNLEPCSHYGQTPPCSLLIEQKKIPRVVIGCVDTFSKVSGSGIQQLKTAGVHVTTGILEQESRELNRRFFTFHEAKRPYIILKWATTRDGFLDIDREIVKNNRPTWITNEHARRMVHLWRSREQAILVGSVTALKDIKAIMEELYNRQIQSLIVEGGARLLNAFIKKGLWDEARVFVGNQWFQKGIKSPELHHIPLRSEKFGNSEMFMYRNI